MANARYIGPNRAIYERATGTFEQNNQQQGRTGGGTRMKDGPARKGKGTALPTNPISGGGINRATQPKS